MKTGQCHCGNRVYFGNIQCLGCNAVIGRCNQCESLSTFVADGSDYQCGSCGSFVHPCNNRTHQVCNSFNEELDSICQWCAFTTVIPDLNKSGNVERWSALEAAKRSLLLELEFLQLPPFVDDLRTTHPLRFQFLEDVVDQNGRAERRTTGHDQGLITINIQEADSVQREKLRVALGEPQRTLIGHMRHEAGHYIDWSFASRVAADGYKRLFGDPASFDYDISMQTHYEQGAPEDWAKSHVSQYATMHPWEDFAETVNAYLDIMAIAITANDRRKRKLDLTPTADAGELVASVLEIAVEVSEYNFDLGLPSLLPERLPPAVVEKLEFVHFLRGKHLPG